MKYNIGAGRFRKEGWVNVNHASGWYKRVQSKNMVEYDIMLMEPLPLETNSADVVYSSNTIEHVTDEAAQNMFNESYRVLKFGGVIRIAAPNIMQALLAYRDGNVKYFKFLTGRKSVVPISKASLEQKFLWHFVSNATTLHSDGAEERITDDKLRELLKNGPVEDALNYCTSKVSLEKQKLYPGNHINWWGSDKLKRFLKKAGFRNVWLSDRGGSTVEEMRDIKHFDPTPHIDFYMESVK